MGGLRFVSLLAWFLMANLASANKIENSEDNIRRYDADVIVVGCGVAGLAAVTRLTANNVSVLCLEAESRVGGRVDTQRYGNGVIEFGAEWIYGVEGNSVYDLAQTNNITIPTPPKIALDYYLSNGSKPNQEQCDEMNNFLFDQYDSINQSSEETRLTINTYLNQKFEQYMAEKPNLRQERNFWNSFFSWFIKTTASEDAVDSYDNMSTKGLTDFEDCGDPLNCSWGSKGYWTLFDILLGKTEGNPTGLPVDIKLNTEVQEINWIPEKTTDRISARTANGSVYTAKTIIVTVSLGVLQHRYKEIFNPALPTAKQNGINLLEMGTLNKILLHYDYAWWNKDKEIGFIWSKEDVEALPENYKWLADISIATASEGSPDVLTFWLCGESARNMELIPLGSLTEKLNFILTKFFKPHYPNLPAFRELRRSTWSSNPHFCGSYSYHGLRSDVEEDPTRGLREPLLDSVSGYPRLLFAGEATHPRYYATVNGALRSGWREADRLLALRSVD